ncbi:MAG: hypothetical protein A3J84_07860 [Ignavibacteria bacterium RIFOXYA2_FULL_37_17]|nr:MAG: hypothetical protein A3J84_07860 [Ignavibacteria bacterium RIFOXYA2_FULL_37_17]
MKNKINSLVTFLLFAIVMLQTSIAGDAKKAENFKLKDYNGKEYQLSDFKNSKATVILFVATQCPVSNAYNPRMAQLYNDYKDKGVTFLGINSNKQESVDEIKEHAKSNKLDFIILKDLNNVVANKFDASFTPEIYVLNGNSEILYHGRIDDNRRESDVKTKDLRAALDEILAGKKVSVSETKAFGCTIKRVD